MTAVRLRSTGPLPVSRLRVSDKLDLQTAIVAILRLLQIFATVYESSPGEPAGRLKTIFGIPRNIPPSSTLPHRKCGASQISVGSFSKASGCVKNPVYGRVEYPHT